MPGSKLLGLDVGDARVGVAIGTVLPSHAEPIATLKRAGGEAEAKILQIISDRAIETIIVGLPLGENGERTSQCSKIENFCRRLQNRTSVRIEFVDEYSSSNEAAEVLGAARGQGRRRTKKNGHGSDAVAAAIILQRYIDENAPRKKNLAG